MKSLTSFSTRKLDEILASLSEDGNRIAKLVPIVQERLNKGEREDAAEEREKAGIARNDILALLKEQREEASQKRKRKLETIYPIDLDTWMTD